MSRFKFESVREYAAIYGRQKLYSKSKGGYDFGKRKCWTKFFVQHLMINAIEIVSSNSILHRSRDSLETENEI